MTTSDKILEFIDGTLEGADEQTLFDEMAKLPELRTELRHYVQIGDAVRADREAYAPPADVERRLLGGLGLIPLGAAGGGVAGGAAGMIGLLGMKSGLLPMMLGFILGGLLVGGGVWLALDDDGDDTRVAAVRTADGDRDAQSTNGTVRGGAVRGGTVSGGIETASTGWLSSIGAMMADLGAITTLSSGNASGGSSGPTVVYKDRFVDRYVPAPISNVNDKKTIENESELDGANHEEVEPTLDPPTARPVTLSPIETTQPAFPVVRVVDGPVDDLNMRVPTVAPTFDVPTDEGRSVHIELRKSVAERPFIENNARPVETQFLNDFFAEGFVGGAHYATGSRTTIGVEVGRERFSQSLLYNREDTLIIEQRPAIMWAAVALNHDVRPFGVPMSLGISLGGSEYAGPLVRGRVGIDLFDLFGARLANGPVSLPLSGELSSLVYTYNDQYMITGNMGLTVGVNYRFGF